MGKSDGAPLLGPEHRQVCQALDAEPARQASLHRGFRRDGGDEREGQRHPDGALALALGYIYQLLAMVGWTSLPWLRALRQPTLILMGRDDPLVPVANGHILARLIPNARLEVIDDGHLFIVAYPVETARRIERFLQGEP